MPPAALARWARPSITPRSTIVSGPTSETAWSSIRPAHAARIASNTGQEIASCGGVEST